MKKRLATVLVAVMGTVAMSAACAADLTAGPYINIMTGKADGNNPTYENGGSWSVGGGVGYRVIPELGIEIFTRGLDFEIFRGQTDYQYPERHSGVAAVAELPLNRWFGITGRVGLGQTQMKQSRGRTEDRVSASTGAGLAWHMGSHFTLTLSYERYTRVNVDTWLFGYEARY